MIKYSSLVGVVIFSMSAVAHAGAASGPYIGGNIGYNTGADGDSLSTSCGTAGVSCRDLGDTEDVWSVYGGYPLSPNLAAELGYTDLIYTARAEESTDGTATSRGQQESKGVSLSLKGMYPVMDKLDVYGKLGAFFWESDMRATAGSASDSGTSPTVGVGLEYAINDNFDVRAGWDRYLELGTQGKLVEDGTVGTLDEDVDAFTIGVNYNF